jgi:hypothetical protein
VGGSRPGVFIWEFAACECDARGIRGGDALGGGLKGMQNEVCVIVFVQLNIEFEERIDVLW